MNTIIPPIYLKAIFYIARLREKGQGFVINHPLLLFVAALVYLLVGDIAVFVAVALALLVMFPVGWAFSIVEPEWTNTAIVLVLIIGAALEMIILVDFIRLVLLCFFSASSLRSITDPVFRVLQLVALTVILFAIAHYYVDLFANTDNVG